MYIGLLTAALALLTAALALLTAALALWGVAVLWDGVKLALLPATEAQARVELQSMKIYCESASLRDECVASEEVRGNPEINSALDGSFMGDRQYNHSQSLILCLSFWCRSIRQKSQS